MPKNKTENSKLPKKCRQIENANTDMNAGNEISHLCTIKSFSKLK